MTYLVYGKVLETFGAILVAYVVVRAAKIELSIGQLIKPHDGTIESNDLERLRKDLKTVLDRRNEQFGFYEAILSGIGTLLIAIGCALYLIGILREAH